MKQIVRFFPGLLVAAFMLAAATANPAAAQDKTNAAKAEKGKVTVTVLAESDKVASAGDSTKAGRGKHGH